MGLQRDVGLTEKAGGWPAGTCGMAIHSNDTIVDVMPYDNDFGDRDLGYTQSETDPASDPKEPQP